MIWPQSHLLLGGEGSRMASAYVGVIYFNFNSHTYMCQQAATHSNIYHGYYATKFIVKLTNSAYTQTYTYTQMQ